MAFLTYPAVDEDFRFSPEVRAALFAETELDEKLIAAYSTGAQYVSRLAMDAVYGVKRILETGLRSSGQHVAADSTANDPSGSATVDPLVDQADWPYFLQVYQAAKYPAFTHQRVVWDDVNERMKRPMVYALGPNGRLYLDGGTGNAREIPAGNIPYLPGTVDIRWYGRLAAYDVDQILVACSGGAGAQGWIFKETSTGVGRPSFSYATNGSDLFSVTANNALAPAADNTDVFLRVVWIPNNGAGGNTAKFYSSVDGLVWTQLGTDRVTAGAVTLFDNSALQPVRIGGNTAGIAGMRTYEVQIRDGDDGPIVAPILPDLWEPIVAGEGLCVGSPVFTTVIGGKAGGSIDYLMDAARKGKLTPNWGQGVGFMSQSHNSGMLIGPPWAAKIKTWDDYMYSRFPGVPMIYDTQNPQLPGAVNAEFHNHRCLEIPSVVSRLGRGFVDTFKAIQDVPGWEATLMRPADNVHLNSLGSEIKAAPYIAMFEAA